MDVIFDWNLGNMIYNGLITHRLCGFPFVEIRGVSVVVRYDGIKEKNDSDVSKCSAAKAEQHNIPSESVTSRETSLATEKHEKRKNPAGLDFLGAN